MSIPAQQNPADQRLAQIERARSAVLLEGRPATDVLVDALYDRAWIERSWRRCLTQGQRPDKCLGFDIVGAPAARHAGEASRELVQAARPVLEKLGRVIANARYFAILTDARGIVIDVNGNIDRHDRRARVIARVGVDLSERAVGTTAIGAALSELQPVWLHRGEHFFRDAACYSCAGAPLFGPDGACVGMLDLTGIEAAERPELLHLAAQSARSIENALVLGRPHRLQLRLAWPGRAMGDDTDGLVCLDADGWVTGCNQTAREMASQGLVQGVPVHASEVFAQPWEELFDAATRADGAAREVPLWSGIRLEVLSQRPGEAPRRAPAPPALPLKDLEVELIRKAVDDAGGSVLRAARALGISRATVYRKLGRSP